MNIKFVAKNVKLSGALKAFIERQLRSIEKIGGDIIGVEVFVSQQKLNFKVEIIVKTKQHSYHAEDKSQILKQATRETLNALKSQIKKNKEKLKIVKKRSNKTSFREKFLKFGKPEVEKTVNQSKIAISDMILKKPSRFNQDEFEIMKQHTFLGARLFLNSQSDFDEAAFDVALNHHHAYSKLNKVQQYSKWDMQMYRRPN